MFKKRENVTDIEEGDLLSTKFDNDGLLSLIHISEPTRRI